jgi:hypothetical protein
MLRARRYVPFLSVLAVLVVARPARPAEPRDDARQVQEAQALAGRIDRLLAERWAAAKVKPAAPADDAEFLRRVWLDLAGTIPSVSDVRSFLDDRRPDKRQRLVEQLLSSPAYATHFSHVWRAAILPEKANQNNFGLDASFEAWLRQRLAANAGYDRMVRELLAALPRTRGGRQAVFDQSVSMAAGAEATPAAFYLANENKPENLAGNTARTFLALKIECAQCHNHPSADWKQEQFWAFAAFFSTAQGGNGRQIRMPKTAQMVQAMFPDGTTPTWTMGAGSGSVLAEWMTRPDNPYFARAAANRVWAYLLGTGLVEPVDDLSQDEDDGLLDLLAREFVQHGYDLKYLIRSIVLTRAYQLTSRTTSDGDDEVRVFARMPLRALAPEQIFSSLTQATGMSGVTPDLAARFARQQTERPRDGQTSILQALTLMNGKFIDDATGLERSETLAAVASAPFLDTAGKVETLYLAVLSRRPRPEEKARLVKYVENGDREHALADVFWTLLNSGEFLLNH